MKASKDEANFVDHNGGEFFIVDMGPDSCILRKYDQGEFVDSDFQADKGIVKYFLGKDKKNEGLFYFHVDRDGDGYALYDDSMREIGGMDIKLLGPHLGVSRKYRNRGFGTLITNLAINHYEKSHGAIVSNWDVTNVAKYKIAKRNGFGDPEDNPKRAVYKDYGILYRLWYTFSNRV